MIKEIFERLFIIYNTKNLNKETLTLVTKSVLRRKSLLHRKNDFPKVT